MTVTGLFGLLCAVQVQAGLLLAPATLLGVVSWDTLIRISLLVCAWLGLVVAWVFVINVIREKYCQHRQNNREYNQPCGEPFDSMAGNLSPLGKRDLKFGDKLRPEMRIVCVFNRLYESRYALLNFQCVKGLLEFFRHKRGDALPPNDPSSANGGKPVETEGEKR